MKDLASLKKELYQNLFHLLESQLENLVSVGGLDFRPDGFFGGFPVGSSEVPDFIYTLSLYEQAGGVNLGGRSIREWIGENLNRINGEKTETFYSYRTAETLLNYGRWEENELLVGRSRDELENLAKACDSTGIFDKSANQLNKARNYWGVLARCERGRRELGLDWDKALYERCLEEALVGYRDNPMGFHNDIDGGRGRYDIYTADLVLFLEPLWDDLGMEEMQTHFMRHLHLVEKIIQENGASFCWGRSTGALSVAMSLEIFSLALAKGWSSDPGRIAGLVQYIIPRMESWFEEGLITAHRDRMTFGYRGPHRWLQMTLDVLGKLAYTVQHLKEASERYPDLSPVSDRCHLFPKRDEWIPMGPENAGVWIFRNDHQAFQFPVIPDPWGADYLSWPQSPGRYENPVDSIMVAGLPRLKMKDGSLWWPCCAPAKVEHSPGKIRVLWDSWRNIKDGSTVEGHFELLLHPQGSDLYAEMKGQLPPECVAASVMFFDGPRSFAVDFEGDSGWSKRKLKVRGSPPFRSYWNGLTHLHEAVCYDPEEEFHLNLAVRPVIKVVTVPGDHDYVRCFYDQLAGKVEEYPLQHGIEVGSDRERALRHHCEGADIFHLGWPEHLFAIKGETKEFILRVHREFIQFLNSSGTRIVWTLHNRLPHRGPADVWEDLYQEWAKAADVLLHHSEWGARRMRREMPFQKDATHHFIPHPHFGRALQQYPGSRKDLEERWGLRHDVLRIGLLGRPQKEKNLDLVLNAFSKVARDDLELLVTAVTSAEAHSDDKRVKMIPMEGWRTRQEIADHLRVCDVLICAHDANAERYLTSGVPADAIGAGIPMITTDWGFFREICKGAALFYDGSEEGLQQLMEEIRFTTLDRFRENLKILYQDYDPVILAEELRKVLVPVGTKPEGIVGLFPN